MSAVNVITEKCTHKKKGTPLLSTINANPNRCKLNITPIQDSCHSV